MEKTGGSITSEYMWGTKEEFLFTYNESEKQEHEINKNNAELVLNPKFIPLYPKLLQNGYGLVESILLGFIDFFIGNGNKFYCTNEQLAKLLNCSEKTISTAMKSLESRGDIVFNKKMRAGGGTVRFVTLGNVNFTLGEMKKVHGIKNKIIKNNKINNLENQNKEDTQKTNTLLSKPDTNITPNLTSGDLTFENIYNLFYHKSGHKPSLEKCKKVFDALNLDKEGYNMLVKDLKLFRIEYKYGIKDQMYRPGFEKYVGGFNAEGVNEEYRLKTIIKFHMDNTDDKEKMKKRYADLCETFGKDEVDALVKAYGRAKNKITLNIN